MDQAIKSAVNRSKNKQIRFHQTGVFLHSKEKKSTEPGDNLHLGENIYKLGIDKGLVSIIFKEST